MLASVFTKLQAPGLSSISRHRWGIAEKVRGKREKRNSRKEKKKKERLVKANI